MKRIIAVVISICILFCSCSVKAPKSEKETEITRITEKADDGEFIRAIWLSYMEISELCKNKNEEQFRESVIDLAANLLSLKINTAIVHAVAFCDSFYESGMLDKSKYINSDKDYDVFGIICEICAKADIKVHAWINPYRVSVENDALVFKENKAVNELYKKNKNNILITESGIYLNPGEPDVLSLIVGAAREIIEKYNVEAIHVDDYFYPDLEENADESSYNEYLESNGSLKLDDWRRENVNLLISSLHLLTSSHGKMLAVSPSADIKKNFDNKYANIIYWLSEGWVDLIIPQIYFGFENENAPFEETLDKWIEATEEKPTKLIIGLAVYKCGKEDINAGTGKNEWRESSDIISRQIRLIKDKNTIYGVAFFSYSHIFGKNIEKIAKKELQNAKNVL